MSARCQRGGADRGEGEKEEEDVDEEVFVIEEAAVEAPRGLPRPPRYLTTYLRRVRHLE